MSSTHAREQPYRRLQSPISFTNSFHRLWIDDVHVAVHRRPLVGPRSSLTPFPSSKPDIRCPIPLSVTVTREVNSSPSFNLCRESGESGPEWRCVAMRSARRFHTHCSPLSERLDSLRKRGPRLITSEPALAWGAFGIFVPLLFPLHLGGLIVFGGVDRCRSFSGMMMMMTEAEEDAVDGKSNFVLSLGSCVVWDLYHVTYFHAR